MKEGAIVRSMRGHDKNRFYVVVSLSGGKVYIADGKVRKLHKPKAKNEKHLSVTNMVVEKSQYTTDKSLRQLLRPLNEAAGLIKGG